MATGSCVIKVIKLALIDKKASVSINIQFYAERYQPTVNSSCYLSRLIKLHPPLLFISSYFLYTTQAFYTLHFSCKRKTKSYSEG